MVKRGKTKRKRVNKKRKKKRTELNWNPCLHRRVVCLLVYVRLSRSFIVVNILLWSFCVLFRFRLRKIKRTKMKLKPSISELRRQQICDWPKWIGCCQTDSFLQKQEKKEFQIFQIFALNDCCKPTNCVSHCIRHRIWLCDFLLCSCTSFTLRTMKMMGV